MDYSKKAAAPKKQTNARETGARSDSTNKTENLWLFNRNKNFSRNQNREVSTKTRVLRPPVPGPFSSKVYSKTTNSGPTKNFSIKEETSEDKKERLKQHLIKFESPFAWRPRQVKPVNDPETIISRLEEKDKEIKDERKFKWRNFIFQLVISYELYNAKKLSQAFEKVCSLESTLAKVQNRGCWMFSTIEDALWHVIITSKAFLYLEQDKLTEAEELLGKIRPVGTMSRQNKAGIHGIRAAVFMEYGHRGNKNALNEARQAVELDRTGAEWHFLISKCMGRIRRVSQCHELVDPLEVTAINRAVKLDQQNGSYNVFLAQVLSERAFREYKKNYPKRGSELYGKLYKTNRAALHIFKSAVDKCPDCPHILMRCAKGIMKLPNCLKDLKFIKECIDKAIELAPNNPMVHHVKGMYYERFDVDPQIPSQAYEKAASLGNFGAALDLVRLHYKLHNTDVIKELEVLATIFEEPLKLHVIYAQAGSYMLFMKKNIVEALKYYNKIIDMDRKAYAMMSHKPIFFRLRDPVNMFEVLLEELASKTDWESFPPDDVKVLRNFRIRAREHDTGNIKRLTVEEILNMSRKINEEDELYKERKKTGTKRIKMTKNSGKRWRGKKKEVAKGKSRQKQANNNNREKSSSTNENELSMFMPQKGSSVCKRTDITKNVGTMERRDSNSSVGTVDSDYFRDSTIHGSRGFFLRGSTESLHSVKSETFGPTRNAHCYSSDLPMKSNVTGKYFSQSERTSRDSSVSSVSSTCSSVNIGNENTIFNSQHNLTAHAMGGSLLSMKNVKEFDFQNSHNIGTKRFSMMSLSSTSLESNASSSDSLSVMDRVRQSYAMLDYKKGDQGQGKKKPFNGSTQSLNLQQDSQSTQDCRRTVSSRSGSSQSLNTLDEKQFKRKSSETFKPSFKPRKSSVSFMPNFACKNLENDSEKM